MNPINKVLYHFGVTLNRIDKIPKEFKKMYDQQYISVKNNQTDFEIIKKIKYETGEHPLNFANFECHFASFYLNDLNPSNILDIGSYRNFILGILSHSKLTTVDVRDRNSILDNEKVITCDAKKLEIKDNSFDVVMSLCTLEHIGLGRYGDDFDLDGDKKMFNEMVRVLKPNGHLIFSTCINLLSPHIAFNTHRVYNYSMIKEFCNNLICVEEKFYSKSLMRECLLTELTINSGDWGVYCGCWKKLMKLK